MAANGKKKRTKKNVRKSMSDKEKLETVFESDSGIDYRSERQKKACNDLASKLT